MTLDPTWSETSITLISEGTRIEGKLLVESLARIHGTLIGEVQSLPGSTLVLGESGLIEGNVAADSILIDGYVKGDIRARARVVISGTGRVIGNIASPSLQIESGAYFEGRAEVLEPEAPPEPAAADEPAPSPA